MSIQEVHNTAIELRRPTFTCDSDFRPPEQIPDPLPRRHHCLLFCAPPGSGKTSLMLSLIMNKRKLYNKIFDNVQVIMPPASRASVKQSPFKKHHPEKLHDELTYEVLDGVLEGAKELSESRKNTLLIIDDMAAQLKNGEIQKLMQEIINNRRHYRLTMWVLSQSYIATPLAVRKLVSHLAMWKMPNTRETDQVSGELVHLPKDLWRDVQRYAFKAKHDFLFVDTQAGKYYRNFNELILPSSDNSLEAE